MGDGTLTTLGIGVSSLCNMNCCFCYSQDERKLRKELPLETWRCFFQKNAAFIKDINYGTGENVLSDSWFQLIAFVRGNYPHIPQALTTNGSLAQKIVINKRRAVIDNCIDEIDISIDFACAEKHDRMRGFSGAFDMAVRTLGFCRDFNKRSTIVMLGEEKTLQISNLEKLFDLAVEYGAYLRINLYRHVSAKSPFHAPNLDTVIKALNWIVEHHFVVTISEPIFSSLYHIESVLGSEKTTSLRILPNGDITPSTYLINEEWVAGNIQQGNSLEEIIKAIPFQRFRQQILPGECAECCYAHSCQGGTKDRRFLEWGNLNSPDIYCPQNAASHNEKPIYRKVRVLGEEGTVHSHYLPTMIFSP